MSTQSPEELLPSHRYLIVDVFNASYGSGNPLGVVLDAQGWSDGAMQRFAAWTNLVETTFLLPPTSEGSADYKVRIFTPHKEIPFAGHPSVGSAHAFLAMRGTRAVSCATSSASGGQISEMQLVQECGAGLLKIAVDFSDAVPCIYVQAPSCRIIEQQPQGARESLDAILAAQPLGTTPPAYLEGGRKWWLAEFATEAAVRSFQPDYQAIEALATASQSLGLCIFSRSSPLSLVVRAFPLGAGIKEDPASGAANGLIASYLLTQVHLAALFLRAQALCAAFHQIPNVRSGTPWQSEQRLQCFAREGDGQRRTNHCSHTGWLCVGRRHSLHHRRRQRAVAARLIKSSVACDLYTQSGQ
jgi:PhzF family phenazine biosynthesis protein